MHRSRLGAVIIDCQGQDMAADATFWSEALGRSVDEANSDDRYVSLSGPDEEVNVLLQRVEHPSRVHLDIETDDIPAEVARLEKLGARRVADIKGWTVMEAPSGHRFCVVKPQRADFPANATDWD